MSEILSQSEIDELLNSLMASEDSSSGESDDASATQMKIKEYDFRTANRFPKEQMRTFGVVFESFSQLFASKLSSILRVSVDCEVLSIEECSYSEFNNSLPAPVILALMEAPPMVGSLLFQMSPEFSYMLISRLFGGVTTGENSKQFTEIELALIERLLRQVIGVFDEAWDKVISLSSHLDRVETSPQFAQISAPNEPVAVVIVNVNIGEESGLMSICMPHSSIEPVSEQLNTRMWFARGSNDDGKQAERFALLSERLMHTQIPLTAFFDHTPATVHDVFKLQVGDVIKLDHGIDKPLTVNVQHIPKFRASIGMLGSRYAMQIVDIIKEEKSNESFAR